jgi:hypothetical protein
MLLMIKMFGVMSGWPVIFPNILESYSYASRAVRNNCGEMMAGKFVRGTFILDSAFNQKEGDITNKMLIKKGIEIGADYVVPKDFPNDAAKTISSVDHFLELVPEPWPFKILIPLQRPYEDSFQFFKDYDYFGLGGLLGLPPSEQLKHIKDGVKLLASHKKKIHIFGIFPKGEILKFFHEHSDIITSFDTSVPATMAKHGQFLDIHQNELPPEQQRLLDIDETKLETCRSYAGDTLGKHTTFMRYQLARYNLYMLQTIIDFPDIGAPTGGKGGISVHVKFPPKESEPIPQISKNQRKLFE